MRVVLAAPVFEFLDHFDEALLDLAERGHEIRIATTRRSAVALKPALAAHARISVTSYPAHRGDAWGGRVLAWRAIRDCVHYFGPRYERAPAVRAQALHHALFRLTSDGRPDAPVPFPSGPPSAAEAQWSALLDAADPSVLARLDDLLQAVESAVPSDADYEAFLTREQPDLLLITPLVRPGGAPAADLVKSAQTLGIPTGVLVFSWDNLSTRGLMHVVPDRVFVWNDVQADEAVTLHGVPADRVVVTGAPRFDAFFAMQPSETRGAFCERHGLDPAQPIVTYLCSAASPSPREEHELIVRWVDEIRAHPQLAACNVVVRLHPAYPPEWCAAPLGRGVAVTSAARHLADQSLFDTLSHSAAAVGLNTSAALEAAALGCPVYTLRGSEIADRHQGSLHFWYLCEEEGGFVRSAADFDEHRRQLAEAVSGAVDRDAVLRFAERFLRPLGIRRPAAECLADAIEQFGTSCATRAAAVAEPA